MISEAAGVFRAESGGGTPARGGLQDSSESAEAAYSQVERVLPVVAGVCLLVGDLALVLGAFLLAHWLRFIARDAEFASLGLEQYARMGLSAGLITVVLF